MGRNELPAAIPHRRLPTGAWLVPGFIDTQVNGGGDVLFNDDPSPRGIAAIAAAHRRFGTTALLPTLLSDTPEKMRAARNAIEAAAGVDPSVIGLHYEGPFLSPDKAGVHDRGMLRRPEPGDFDLLAPLRNGVTLVTLAPEQVPEGFIAQLAGAGVRVSLGHSMATYAQTRAALSEGLTGFTHLFNAMRPLASREPGPIAAALEEPGAWFGMIVDGEHVAPAMLRLALRGAGKAMLVTDAMPPVGGSVSSFRLYGQRITVRGGRCTTARRHARRFRPQYGERSPKLRENARSAARRGIAPRMRRAGGFSGYRHLARAPRARLPRRHGRARPRDDPGIGDLGRRKGRRSRLLGCGRYSAGAATLSAAATALGMCSQNSEITAETSAHTARA